MTNQNMKPEESKFVSAYNAYKVMTQAYDSIKITDVLKNYTSDLNTAATEVVKSMSEIIHHTFCRLDDELESFAYELLYKRLERGSNKDRIRLDVFLSEYESGDHALAVFKTFLRNNVMNDYYRTENKRLSKFEDTLQKDTEGKENSNFESEVAISNHSTRSQRQYITSAEDLHIEHNANHRVQRTLFDAVEKMLYNNPISAFLLLRRFNDNYDIDSCTSDLVEAGEHGFKELFLTEVGNLWEVFDLEEYDWMHLEINAEKIAKFYNNLNAASSYKQQKNIVANKASRKNFQCILKLPNAQWLKKAA